MVIIRRAKLSDIDRCMPVIMAFHREYLNDMGQYCTMDKLVEMAKVAINHCYIAETEDIVVGVIAGMVVYPQTEYKLVWHEIVWYVLPEYRKCGMQLYKAMEQHCKDEGIQSMLMIHMCNDIGEKVGKLYEKIGYRPLEKHYIKELV